MSGVDVTYDGRRFCVIDGRRWTKVARYLSNGQLTAGFFLDEATGEARMSRSWKAPQPSPIYGEAAELVRAIVATARVPEPERTVLNVGARWTTPERMPQVLEALEALTWHQLGVGTSAPAMPGLAINAVIDELRLPNVSAIAWDGALSFPPADGDGDGEHPGLYGIESNYRDGRARLYVVDDGCAVLPVIADFWRA